MQPPFGKPKLGIPTMLVLLFSLLVLLAGCGGNAHLVHNPSGIKFNEAPNPISVGVLTLDNKTNGKYTGGIAAKFSWGFDVEPHEALTRLIFSEMQSAGPFKSVERVDLPSASFRDNINQLRQEDQLDTVLVGELYAYKATADNPWIHYFLPTSYLCIVGIPTAVGYFEGFITYELRLVDLQTKKVLWTSGMKTVHYDDNLFFTAWSTDNKYWNGHNQKLADSFIQDVSKNLEEASNRGAIMAKYKPTGVAALPSSPSLPSPAPVKPLSATNTKVWLLAVGVSKYKDPEMNLQFADSDARAVYDLLTNPKGGLVNREKNSTLLLNEQATRKNMVDALNHICKQAFDEDLVILYFAMHGMVDPDGSELFFIASDTEPHSSLASTGVAQGDVEKAISKSKAGKVLMIVDTCHSGSAGLSGVFAQRAISTAAVSNRLLNNIAVIKKGMSIFTASSSTEFSQENIAWGGGHGVFTHYLVEGLKGKADENKDGFVTLRELYDYTYRRVKEETQSNQHPEIKGTLDTNIPLAEVR